MKEYGRDNGAVVFDEITGQWTFCAWIDLGYVFYDEFRGLRLCTPFYTLRLGGIMRIPVDSLDYVRHFEVADMIQRLGAPQAPGTTLEVTSSDMTESFSVVNVDLLQSEEFVDQCKCDENAKRNNSPPAHVSRPVGTVH